MYMNARFWDEGVLITACHERNADDMVRGDMEGALFGEALEEGVLPIDSEVERVG